MIGTGNPALNKGLTVLEDAGSQVRRLAVPVEVIDHSEAHDGSLPWRRHEDGVLHASGFNSTHEGRGINHACMDVTYELEGDGAIAYKWKVQGHDVSGNEIFDSYWFLKGSDGTFLSGIDFLREKEQFSTHVIDGLKSGTYNLTLGVFCFGSGGSVLIDLAPCA